MTYIVKRGNDQYIYPSSKDAHFTALCMAEETKGQVVEVQRYPIPYKRPKFYLIKED